MDKQQSTSLIKNQIDAWRQRAEKSLDNWLPAEDINPARLHQAMRYSVLNGGKRIRPVLVYAAGFAVSADESALDAPASAIEFIHAYSLIHDDLPAMDNDDLRRGKPTCHKAFNEAQAILAGDALQSLAFHALVQGLPEHIPAEQKLDIIDTLAIASGSRGMAGGQAIDLESVGKSLNIAELEDMHVHKTGALIRASVKMGALCQPNIDKNHLKKLDHYAKCIGLAFQIQDDILDVTSDTETLGKTQGADIALNKPTYPALLGLDGAREMAAELHKDAHDSLEIFGVKAEPLRWLADYIVKRDY
ncbi:MAG: (2E,6E)-farnesyl diphosphate synthase [Gammaproteobacteria bacterium]|nr:(2E,6E)-farnesyl diphosphate synthase [Gammaproteobacteria bacterium]